MSDPQTIGQVATQLQGSMEAIASMISVMSYLAGLMFRVKAALRLKAHNENPDNVALSQPPHT